MASACVGLLADSHLARRMETKRVMTRAASLDLGDIGDTSRCTCTSHLVGFIMEHRKGASYCSCRDAVSTFGGLKFDFRHEPVSAVETRKLSVVFANVSHFCKVCFWAIGFHIYKRI